MNMDIETIIFSDKQTRMERYSGMNDYYGGVIGDGMPDWVNSKFMILILTIMIIGLYIW